MSSTDNDDRVTRAFAKMIQDLRARYPQTLERLHESEQQEARNAFLKGIAAMVDDWLEDEACGTADRSLWAVNWADLRVVDVIDCRSAMGNGEFIRVVIEEAMPGCPLEGLIYQRLKAEYPGLEFEVACEW
jgi:hypothetical protein